MLFVPGLFLTRRSVICSGAMFSRHKNAAGISSFPVGDPSTGFRTPAVVSITPYNPEGMNIKFKHLSEGRKYASSSLKVRLSTKSEEYSRACHEALTPCSGVDCRGVSQHTLDVHLQKNCDTPFSCFCSLLPPFLLTCSKM